MTNDKSCLVVVWCMATRSDPTRLVYGLVPNLVKVTSDTTSDKPCNGSVCSNFSPNSFVPNFPLMACGRIFLLFISDERWKNSLTASVRPSKATILTHQLTSSFLVISMNGKPSPVDL